jgi:hypothetical protein
MAMAGNMNYTPDEIDDIIDEYDYVLYTYDLAWQLTDKVCTTEQYLDHLDKLQCMVDDFVDLDLKLEDYNMGNEWK